MQKLKNVRLTGQPAGQKFSTGTGPGRDGRLPLPVTTMIVVVYRIERSASMKLDDFAILELNHDVFEIRRF